MTQQINRSPQAGLSTLGVVQAANNLEISGNNTSKFMRPSEFFAALGMTSFDESPAVTPAASQTYNLTLTRARTPKLIVGVLTCVANDASTGYAADDGLLIYPGANVTSIIGLQTWHSSTTASYRLSASANFLQILKKDGSNVVGISAANAANWTFKIRVFN